MVVVAILVILATLAIGRFMVFQKKAKQAEARQLLVAVYTAEETFFAEQSRYGTLSEAGFTPAETPRYYTSPSLTARDTDSWTAECSGNVDTDATIDVWSSNNNSRAPTNTTNDVLL